MRIAGELRTRRHRHRPRADADRAAAQHGVVGKFVEFFGPGLAALTVADRATLSNMSPEFGATAAMFPVDAQTLRYLRDTGRPADLIALVERYTQGAGPVPHRVGGAAGLLRDARLRPRRRRAEPGRAAAAAGSGVAARRSRARFSDAFGASTPNGTQLGDGSVVIAAITSCTNTSNPALMVAAGLVAQEGGRARAARRPWVKTSLAPGSRVVVGYLERAGADGAARRSSGSTWSASAAPPASATPARCPTRSPARSSATT